MHLISPQFRCYWKEILLRELNVRVSRWHPAAGGADCVNTTSGSGRNNNSGNNNRSNHPALIIARWEVPMADNLLKLRDS